MPTPPLLGWVTLLLSPRCCSDTPQALIPVGTSRTTQQVGLSALLGLLGFFGACSLCALRWSHDSSPGFPWPFQAGKTL